MASTINAKSTGSGSVETTADASGQLALQANGATIATISSTGLAVTGAITSNGVTTSPYTMKNRIINGDMVISQRSGTSVISVTGYTLDRWVADASQASKYTVQQNAGSVTPPTGFTNYLGVTSTAATSLAAGDYFLINQSIEGFNVADLGWGAAGAATVTISFWVRSSLTGTFAGSVRNANADRSYPFNYTISSANTWTKISVTIPGDTTGTWVKNNGTGLILSFSIGTGSTFSGTAGAWTAGNFVSATGATSVVGTNGATWYVTGIQLEQGSSATSFEWLPYSTELALCQRYYWKMAAYNSGGGAYAGVASGLAASATVAYVILKYPVAMRSAATFTGSGLVLRHGTNDINVNSPNIIYPGTDSAMIEYTGLSSTTPGYSSILFINGSTASFFSASAEL